MGKESIDQQLGFLDLVDGDVLEDDGLFKAFGAAFGLSCRIRDNKGRQTELRMQLDELEDEELRLDAAWRRVRLAIEKHQQATSPMGKAMRDAAKKVGKRSAPVKQATRSGKPTIIQRVFERLEEKAMSKSELADALKLNGKQVHGAVKALEQRKAVKYDSRAQKWEKR